MEVVDLSYEIEKRRSLACMSLCKSQVTCGGVHLKVKSNQVQLVPVDLLHYLQPTDPECHLVSVDTVAQDDIQPDPGFTSYKLIPKVSQNMMTEFTILNPRRTLLIRI